MTATTPDFVSFFVAKRLLAGRLKASPEEIAVWVFLGPEHGGLAAYTNANEPKSATRFCFDFEMGPDYLDQTLRCWFRKSELERFRPADRFMTGAALVERWSELGEQVIGFVKAKIRESRLIDIHPVFGATQWTERADYPPRESALFVLAHIKAIEQEDGIIPQDAALLDERGLASATSGVSRNVIIDAFRVRKSDDANFRFWNDKLSDPPNWLRSSRMSSGRPGVSATWNPLLVAHALLEREEMSPKSLDRVMQSRFPEQYHEWREGTGDAPR